MSSMRRSIARSIAKKNGTFEAQKPFRDRSRHTFKEMFFENIKAMKRLATIGYTGEGK